MLLVEAAPEKVMGTGRDGKGEEEVEREEAVVVGAEAVRLADVDLAMSWRCCVGEREGSAVAGVAAAVTGGEESCESRDKP